MRRSALGAAGLLTPKKALVLIDARDDIAFTLHTPR
jgi:hypothetical protein